MRALFLATLTILVGAGSSQAMTCDQSGYSFTPSPDGSRALSVIFGQTVPFEITTSDPGSCVLSVPTSLADDEFAVYSAQYSGFVEYDDQADPAVLPDRLQIDVDHDGVVDTSVVVGPADLTYFIHYIGTTKSGGNTTVNSSIALNLLESHGTSGFATLDSVDYGEVGRTSMGSQQASLNQLGMGRVGLVTHLSATRDLLTGANQPLEGDDEFGLLGGVGSYTLGGTFRRNLGNGLSMLGGAALTDQSAGNSRTSGPIIAGALRYVQPVSNSWRYFGELGIHAAPALGMSFTRHYDDGSPAGATVTGSTSGMLGSIYATAGVLVAPTPSDEIVFSATLMETALSVNGYSEVFSTNNLFAANVARSTSSLTTLKAGSSWTTQLADDVDLTAMAGIGTTFSLAGTTANIAFVGAVNGAPQGTLFAEYGLRLGWTPAPQSKLDAFVNGSSGTNIGTHLQLGAAYHMKF